MNQKEIQLIQKAQKGDTRAFELLICQHDKRILQLACHMLGNMQDAQDVYQETLMRAFQGLPAFAFQCQFSTWLLRITINLCINQYRKRRIQKLLFTYNTQKDLPDDFISKDARPDEKVIVKEMTQHLERAMQSLSAKQRMVFTLKHFYGYKLSEIAEITNSAVGTIKNDLYRATHKLQKLLHPYVKMSE